MMLLLQQQPFQMRHIPQRPTMIPRHISPHLMPGQFWFEACNAAINDPQLALAATVWGACVVSFERQCCVVLSCPASAATHGADLCLRGSRLPSPP